MILSAHGLLVTHIDKNYEMSRWPLSELMAAALRGAPVDPDKARFTQRILDKLKYCKEVLVSIRAASAGLPAGAEPELAAAASAPALGERASKAELR